MGEYASVGGQRVKIGTCEDLYYLRADQVRKVANSDTDLSDPETLSVVRFRFPWPDEDATPPGAFEDYDRGLRLWGVPVPEGVQHGSVQFQARNGYLLSLPCPEGPDAPEGVARNGYGGACSLVQQGWRGGRLVGIARCNGCGARYRLEDGNEEAAAVAIRAEADRQYRTADEHGTEGNRDIGDRLNTIATRLLNGYAMRLEGAA